MFVPLLIFLAGLITGWILWHQPPAKAIEWRLQILMDITSGGTYPLRLQMTRKGRNVALPTGAEIVWSVSDPSLGEIQSDPADQTKALLTAGSAGGTGTVSAKVLFRDHANDVKEIDATSDTLTVRDGEPDAGGISVGDELP